MSENEDQNTHQQLLRQMHKNINILLIVAMMSYLLTLGVGIYLQNHMLMTIGFFQLWVPVVAYWEMRKVFRIREETEYQI